MKYRAFTQLCLALFSGVTLGRDALRLLSLPPPVFIMQFIKSRGSLAM